MSQKSRSGCICRGQLVCKIIGVGLIAFGIPFAIFWPQIFEKILISQMHIGPTSKSYDGWKKPSLPLYMDLYFFNWTNPEDFTNHSTKPILVELGPYRFREQPEKVNITWNDHNSTVSYRQISTFHFDEAGSKGSLTDRITTVNLVTAGANSKSRFAGFFERSGISLGLTMNMEKISIVKTAAELMFDGYSDGMLDAGLKYKRYMDFGEIPYDKVGWFYMRNNTPHRSPVFNVHTGVQDISKFGQIATVNYSSTNNKYADRCGEFFGSSGEFFSFGQKREEPIALLTADMCKTLVFDYEKDIEVHGLKAFKYEGGPRMLDNGTKYPDQACFCEGECQPSGVMNISKCRYDSPVFMSLPHYLHADPFYGNQVEGLNPQKEKHEFFMALEPVTGIPIKVAARLQANILIRRNTNMALFKNIKDTYIPAMWVENLMTLDEESTNELKMAAMMPKVGRIIGLIMVAIGVALQFIAICWCSEKKITDKGNWKEAQLNKNVEKKAEIPLIQTKQYH